MAVINRNSCNSKSIEKRKRNLKKPSLQTAQRSEALANAIPARTIQNLRNSWIRAKRQVRRIFDRLRSSAPVDNLPPQNSVVLIDACNVGYFYTNHRGFSAEGVRLALQHFFDRGFEAYGMLPRFRLKPGKSSDYTVLDMLYKNGRLIATPCKEFPVRGMAYDDRFMLEIATKYGCAIVSNDQYRDVMHERPGWADCVRQRRRGFQWNGSYFMLS